MEVAGKTKFSAAMCLVECLWSGFSPYCSNRLAAVLRFVNPELQSKFVSDQSYVYRGFLPNFLQTLGFRQKKGVTCGLRNFVISAQ